MTEFRSDMERMAWRMVKDVPEFDRKFLERRSVHENTARSFIKRWLLAGRIREVRKEDRTPFYAPVDAAEAARVETTAMQSREVSPEGNMWRAMRRHTTFTPIDLAALSSVGEVDVTVEKARSYCRHLLEAGYLRVRETAIPGKRQPRYQLIRNTGPMAPVVRRVSGVQDPNKETFTPLNGRST